MPELPEVQTVAREVAAVIIGHKMAKIQAYKPETLIGNIDVKPGVVKRVSTRGKFIIISAQNTDILVHLRMTGKLLSTPEPPTHCRATFFFDDIAPLYFDDARRFGRIWVQPSGSEFTPLVKLGPEPLKPQFDGPILAKNLHGKKQCIKTALLDQTVVAGLGNIYVCEVLYRMRLNPNTPAGTISMKTAGLLADTIKEVLTLALEHNGTTISDYRRVDDKKGGFQNFLQVYGKKQCPLGHEIKRDKHAGRSTYWCPQCQR